MARPTGRRNLDFQEKRLALLDQIIEVMRGSPPGASLRELALQAGTSPTAVRYYFGDRDGLVTAAMERLLEQGQPFMTFAAEPREATAEASLQVFLSGLLKAWRSFGVGAAHLMGLSEGLREPRLGPAYVTSLLEPTLQCAELLLARLVERGQLPPQDLRAAAIALVGPVYVALVHQEGLNGVTCRPLDVDALCQRHVLSWLSGHAGPPALSVEQRA